MIDKAFSEPPANSSDFASRTRATLSVRPRSAGTGGIEERPTGQRAIVGPGRMPARATPSGPLIKSKDIGGLGQSYPLSGGLAGSDPENRPAKHL